MQDKLEWIEGRFAEIGEIISQPETIADTDKLARLMREHAQLEPVVEAHRGLRRLLIQRQEAEEMLSDPAMEDMAQEEIRELARQIEEARHALQVLLLPQDPNDDKNVVLEVRAGAGGDEAGLFGAMLLRMYQRYAERNGWKWEVIDGNFTELGGVKEAVMTIAGKNAFKRLKFESGVHRVQRVPSTEASGRIHTSTATVAVLPEAEDVDIQILPGDLRIDVYRSTGHGGQYINTTDSAVRITHLPTGVVVTCQDEKSQLKNREKAMRVLKSRLYDFFQSQKDEAYAQNRKSQIGTGDRSERIRTYNFPQGRITDHRLGLTLYQIEEFIDGDCDKVIEPLLLEDEARRLKELSGGER